MRRKLRVLQSKPSGVPYAEVPLDVMWGLVEYLSWQRVLASYNFATTHFTVTFPHLDIASAQKLMDDWDATQDRNESAESCERPLAHAS